MIRIIISISVNVQSKHRLVPCYPDYRGGGVITLLYRSSLILSRGAPAPAGEEMLEALLPAV